MKHNHDKGLPDWLAGKMTPSALKLFLIHGFGLNNGISENLLQAPKNLELGLDISQELVMVIVTIPFIIIKHILYKLMFPFLLL